jgi:N-acetylmuramoyl-L-alanine amidase
LSSNLNYETISVPPMTLRFLAAVAAALAVPGVASAGLASAVTRDVPVGRDRALASASATRFDLVGVSWRGTGSVAFSVRSTSGRWGRWLPAAPEAEDGPDRRAAESGRSAGRRLGNPWWVGPSNGIRYRIRGPVSALRATFVRSPVLRVPLRRPAAAASPAIVPRSGWSADETTRRVQPEYAPAIRLAVVHHTAGANDYTVEQAAAIVRGIQVYHVQANGWNDIGYNFLVDRFGTVYEGRYGGIDQNVVGAHAQGFNTGSVGIAVLGNYEGGPISSAAEKSLAEIIAWRLDLAHVDPLSTLSYLSNGNPRYPAGLPVFLRAVSGHRDTGQTACPGAVLYDHLASIAARAQGIGLPKLYAPLAEGALGSPIRFTGTLSEPATWTVRVVDAATGADIASGRGSGRAVDWTWDASLVSSGSYTWRIEAGARVTAAAGVLGVTTVKPGLPPGPSTQPAPAVAFGPVRVEPATITPNGDGHDDAATITYALSANANVRADVLDSAGGLVAELERPRWRRAGDRTLSFDGLDLPDGAYTVRLTAKTAAAAETTADVMIAVTRILASLSAAPAVLTADAVSRGRPLGVTFSLSRPARVVVTITRAGRWVATPFSGLLTEGRQLVEWDGTKLAGTVVDGEYAASVVAEDEIGTASLEASFLRDTIGPTLRLVSRKPAVLAVGEAGRITGLVNNARRAFQVVAPGKVRIPRIAEISSLALFARDAAGNLTTLRLTR